MAENWIIEAKGATDVGVVRSVNQDSFFVDADKGVFVVADGMGGHAGGEIASQMCIEKVVESLDKDYFKGESSKSEDISGQKINSYISTAINYSSTAIYEKSLENPKLKGMGTTATAMLQRGLNGYVGHVGDSRLYLIRAGFIYQLTEDHSLVTEQLRAGMITKEEAEKHQLKNIITRSVGYQEEEEVDVLHLELEIGDHILICSDGLHGKVESKEICDMIQTHGVEAVKPLIDLANRNGGEDNITVVILKVALK